MYIKKLSVTIAWSQSICPLKYNGKFDSKHQNLEMNRAQMKYVQAKKGKILVLTKANRFG